MIHRVLALFALLAALISVSATKQKSLLLTLERLRNDISAKARNSRASTTEASAASQMLATAKKAKSSPEKYLNLKIHNSETCADSDLVYEIGFKLNTCYTFPEGSTKFSGSSEYEGFYSGVLSIYSNENCDESGEHEHLPFFFAAECGEGLLFGDEFEFGVSASVSNEFYTPKVGWATIR
jgi:hypothetical protein